MKLFSSQGNLIDRPLEDRDVDYVTDESSSVLEEVLWAGPAIVTLESVMKAQSLPTGTSAAKTELTALTKALSLEKRKVNIYTDAKCLMLHIHT